MLRDGRGRACVATALAVGAVLAMPAPAPAAKHSLYSGPAPRPGPDILYRKPAKAPQLRNRGPWHAKPILVSGASSYRKGEFIYQDFIYDDTGAHSDVADPNDPRTSHVFSLTNGTYTYPTAPDYAGNAADLVELRVKRLARATALRITLNSLTDPDLVGTTIALGNSATPREIPHGAAAEAPASRFLTIHGSEGELVRAKNGSELAPAPKVHVSRRRNQIDVRISHRAWNPRSRTVRMAAGVGLWDEASDSYMVPGASASATAAGGAAGLPDPTAFFNLAFRFDEPFQSTFPPDSVFNDPAWWRDRAQAAALASGDLSPFHAEVDFGKLRAHVRDDMTGEPGGAPATGPMDRILSSHFDEGEGTAWEEGCGNPDDCIGELRGRLQPYAIYVPEGPPPPGGWGMTLLLHSLDANYNQFASSNNQSQLGDRGDGSIVITSSGRGPDGWYWGHAGADTFEAWADAAKRYPLDPAWTSISGYSMGGYATYKFATQFPDLFARANPVVGPPGLGIWLPPADPQPGGAASNTNRMLASVRHIPFLIWDGVEDELVPVLSAITQAQTFDDLDYRYEFDLFATADHFALATNDQYAPAADFLGDAEVDRNPAHVTYVVNPKMDFANVGTVADHAYWLSGLRLRDDSGAAALGTVDAFSHAFGEADPAAGSTQNGAGTLTGGNLPLPLAYDSKAKTWDEGASQPEVDALDLDLENLKRVVVHPKRAKLSCDPDVNVTTDGPATVKLAGCGKTLSFP